MKLSTKKSLDYYLGGILLFFLKPVVFVVGKLLKRDHQLVPRRSIGFIKMLGGGSLVLAYPALLGIRRAYPDIRLVLISTKSIAPFGELLGIFDEFVTFDDSTVLGLIQSSIVAWFRCLGIDTVVDLEVYSRLTSVFSVFTLARNRIGFYLESVFWRRQLHTHLIFFNRFSGIFYFYQGVAKLLGAETASIADCRAHMREPLNIESHSIGTVRTIGIGHSCSENGAERMLSANQWLKVMRQRLRSSEPTRVLFLGGAKDHGFAEVIRSVAAAAFPEVEFDNLCGKLSLRQSVGCLSSLSEFWGIDSSLLHFARLLGVSSTSFWGPTDPETRLQPVPGLREEIHYRKVPCSPCIHVAEQPPCNGRNRCIGEIFEPSQSVDWFPTYDIEGDDIARHE